MKYKIAYKIVFIFALMVGAALFVNAPKAAAGSICPDGNPKHSSVVANLIATSPNHPAPESVKDNVQMCINKYGARTYGPFWLEPASYTGTGIKDTTAWAAILVVPGVSYTKITGGKIEVTGSTNNFLQFPSGCSKTFDIGTVNRGSSEGASRGCTNVNTAKLRSGTHEMCVTYKLTTNFGTDTGSWCGNIKYTPTQDPKGTISGACKGYINIYARDGDNTAAHQYVYVGFDQGIPYIGPVTANKNPGGDYSSDFHYRWSTPSGVNNSTTRVKATLYVQGAVSGKWVAVDSVYIGPCSSPTATVTPRLTASKSTINAGESVTFVTTATISRSGSMGSKTYGLVTTESAPTVPSASGGGNGYYYGFRLDGGSPQPGASNTSMTVRIDVPGTYCRVAYVDNRAGYTDAIVSPKGPSGPTSRVCVTVRANACTGNASTPDTAYVQPGDTTTLRLSFPSATSLSYTLPGGFGAASGTHSVTFGSAQTRYDLTITAPLSANQYTVTWRPNTTLDDCEDTINIVQLPYFVTYNGGVTAGGEFASIDSACGGGGTLASWYNNTSGNGFGAGTQLHALALLKIYGFGSGLREGAGRSPTSLSFANNAADIGSANNLSPILGGNFNSGGGSYCLTEPEQNPSASATDVGSAFAISSSDDGTYTGSGQVTVRGNVGVGKNVGLYVDGDVYIDNNITYASGWSRSNVPSLVLVVSGNIYISPNVTQLDGLYVAKNNSGGDRGRIFTCATGFNAQVDIDQLFTVCNKQLTVYGSFVADKINLMRTYGSLKNANGGACLNAGSSSSSSPHTTCAAEVFQFSPEIYLSKPEIRPAGNGSNQYDSITSLPPVL